MNQDVVSAERLTTFEVAADGSRFCINVADPSGRVHGLSLPAECLLQMMATLPEVASRALKARFRDDSLRLVYPLHAARMEEAPIGGVTVLTLSTSDGYAVSFGLSADHLKQLEAEARRMRTEARSPPAAN